LDIINYNQVVRNLTEWTATNQNNTYDQTSISEGIGGYVWAGNSAALSALTTYGPVNVRQRYIQGVSSSGGTAAIVGDFGNVPNKDLDGFTATGTNYSTRRYQVNLALGLLTQDKLLPVKFMASQLAIELTLETAVNCLYTAITSGTHTGTLPTYAVSNVQLIPEILEFDASYGIFIFFFFQLLIFTRCNVFERIAGRWCPY
jgi:hypothetical protein